MWELKDFRLNDIPLNFNEYRLISKLREKEGMAIDIKELMSLLDVKTVASIRNCISKLKRRIPELPIFSVRGRGYVWDEKLGE